MPSVPGLLIPQDGLLRPIIDSTNALGSVVVPVSCMIVGAELYRSVAHVRYMTSFSQPPRLPPAGTLPNKHRTPCQKALPFPLPLTHSTQTYARFYFFNPKSPAEGKESRVVRSEETFGAFVMVFIIFMRMLLLPLLARSVYTLFNVSDYIANPMLGVFVLVQWGVPTANITVIMVTIAAESLPRIGDQLRRDISKCVFYQILVTPVFLTLNTAAALNIEYPTPYQG